MEQRCIHCGSPMKSLFIQYSPGNIRLMKCDNCKAIADEYIECEIMILLIDLILHKQKAYRHLLYNTMNSDTVEVQGLLWKSSVVYLLLDACRSLFLKTNIEEGGFLGSSFSSMWPYRKVLVDVLVVNLIALVVLLSLTRAFLSSSEIIRYKDLLLAVIISSYWKTFVIAMMVWKFPPSVIYILDMLVLSSNAVALKVMTQSTMSRSISVCFSAYVVKFLLGPLLEILL
ncbi:hypothetical protein Scep_029175 [Stephania cephalantha]|uniref:Protein ARV n=1 Tax=Stephania cephalantha TaxID=152367 RepID=A0AAP0E4S6_9MAGN